MKTINLSYGKTLENKAQVDDNWSSGSQSKDGSVSSSSRALMEASDQAVWTECGMFYCTAEPLWVCFFGGYLVRMQTVDKTKKKKKKKKKKRKRVDKQTSLKNSGKTFANQHTVAPVKTCRLFPLSTPGDTFLMPHWRCAHLSSE